MGKFSAIEWTDATWNPWIGCTKVSPACKNCYAERIETRFGRDFSIIRKSTTFKAPLKWKEPRVIFTCSMSDFFHEDADEWREEAWEVIRQTPQHTYQILTKRPERMIGRLPDTCFQCGQTMPHNWGEDEGESFHMGKWWPWPNVWLGTSVEMQTYDFRIAQLTDVPARIRFLSCEPLLGPLVLDFDSGYIDWVITGGESDPNPRLSNTDWFRGIRDQCNAAGIAYFHKQNGGKTKCKCHNTWGCRLLDGRIWDEMPLLQRDGVP